MSLMSPQRERVRVEAGGPGPQCPPSLGSGEGSEGPPQSGLTASASTCGGRAGETRGRKARWGVQGEVGVAWACLVTTPSEMHI